MLTAQQRMVSCLPPIKPQAFSLCYTGQNTTQHTVHTKAEFYTNPLGQNLGTLDLISFKLCPDFFAFQIFVVYYSDVTNLGHRKDGLDPVCHSSDSLTTGVVEGITTQVPTVKATLGPLLLQPSPPASASWSVAPETMQSLYHSW